MKKKYRLRKRQDFSYIYRRGKSLANSCLVLYYKKNRQDLSRVGFSISKKYGNAVKRNKIKRRLREIYGDKIEDIRTGFDLIFIVRMRARGASFTELESKVNDLLVRSGLYKK